MKALYAPLYWLMGAVFLLVTTVFWSAIIGSLLVIEGQTGLTGPSFWNLATVLTFVRVVFIIVGIFLIAFGIGLFLLKKR
jgi:hypothetical protein